MGYHAGDYRSDDMTPDAAQFNQWVAANPQIRAALANPQLAGDSHAQRVARQAAVHSAVVAGGQHIPKGLKINADGRLETDDSGSGWKTFGKIAAIAAPIAAAPFTGGASLAMIGAGSGAASGLLNGGGWKGALMGGAMGAVPGLGKMGKLGAFGNILGAGGSSAAGAGESATGGAMTFGQKLASLAGVKSGAGWAQNAGNIFDKVQKYGGMAGDIDSALHGGLSTQERGKVAADAASQAAANRYAEARLVPGAVQADAGAYRNYLRANDLANFKAHTPEMQALDTKYGRMSLAPSDEERQFANEFGKQLSGRLYNHQAMTLSGVAPKSAQEMKDEATARQMSSGNPGGFLGALQTGSRLADLAGKYMGDVGARRQASTNGDWEQEGVG